MQAFGYVPGDSPLHRINPTIKLLVVLVLTVGLTFVFDIATPLAFLMACLAALLLVGRIPVSYIVRSMAPFGLLALGFVMFNSVFYIEGDQVTPLLRVGPLTVSREGAELGVSVGLRVLFLIASSLFFVSTTRPSDLVLSLVQQGKVHYKLAFALFAAYRFVPIFADEYRQIQAAARVRGVGEGMGILGSLRRLRRDAVPLLAGAIRRSERMAVAMDSRAFGAYPRRTYRTQLKVTYRDWLFVGAVVLISTSVIALLAAAGLMRGVGVQFG